MIGLRPPALIPSRVHERTPSDCTSSIKSQEQRTQKPASSNPAGSGPAFGIAGAIVAAPAMQSILFGIPPSMLEPTSAQVVPSWWPVSHPRSPSNPRILIRWQGPTPPLVLLRAYPRVLRHARPFPLFHPLHQTSTHGVPMNVLHFAIVLLRRRLAQSEALRTVVPSSADLLEPCRLTDTIRTRRIAVYHHRCPPSSRAF